MKISLRKFASKNYSSFTFKKPTIKVIGVGGAGCNSITNISKTDFKGLDLYSCNTDVQSLLQSKGSNMIQIGKTSSKGMGAGSFPSKGKEAAEESLEEVLQTIGECDVSNTMAFISCGLGGGTGSGATPIIAKALKSKGILTVGVVTKPFEFEGKHRERVANKALEELEDQVDTLLVIPNQKLLKLYPKSTLLVDAFKIVDDVLLNSIKSVTNLVLTPGKINLDFSDISSMLRGMGRGLFGIGEASGPNRAILSAEAALKNPLLENNEIKECKGILINISGGNDLTLSEIQQVTERIRKEVKKDVNIIFGSSIVEENNGKIQVSIVATGIEKFNPVNL